MELFVQRNFYEDGFYANIVIDSQNNPWFRSSLFFKTIALNNLSDFIVYKAFNKKLFISKQSLLNIDEYLCDYFDYSYSNYYLHYKIKSLIKFENNIVNTHQWIYVNNDTAEILKSKNDNYLQTLINNYHKSIEKSRILQSTLAMNLKEINFYKK